MTSSALSPLSGPLTASTKCWDFSCAVATVQFLLRQMTQPNADMGSTLYAVRNASSMVSAEARPQGFVCFMTTAVGLSKSMQMSMALSRSRMLLYESCFPWSCSALATVVPGVNGSL